MAERIVQHAMVTWVEEDADGRPRRSRTAYRRQSVDLDTIPEARRQVLLDAGAFAPEGAEELTDKNNGDPEAGEGGVSTITADTSDEEVLAIVREATVNELLTMATENPDQSQRLLDAEQLVAAEQERDPRKTLEHGLQTVLAQQS